jgi:hypothetical protein
VTELCHVCGCPQLLDLFSCAGGAGMGYRRAGFCVTAVDLNRPSSYPAGQFHRGGALPVLRHIVRYGHVFGHRFAAVHASPPCQNESALTKGNRKRKGWTDRHAPMIPTTRELLDATGLPYVIENVQGAPLRRDLTLCGEQFGLAVIRHRYFELGNWSTEPLRHVPHRGRVAGWRHGEKYAGPYVAVYGDGGGKGSVTDWQRALGIDWTTDKRELAESVPPAYTQFVGARLLEHLDTELAA